MFLPTFKLVNQLLVAKRDLTLPSFGYVSQAQDEIEALFTFFGERYERQKSVLITSNLVFSQWDKIFKNPMTAVGAVDRLVHRSIILEFSGESLRAKAAKDRRQ